MTETKELFEVNLKITRLKEIMNRKAHGPDSNELKLLQQLSELYKKRAQLKQ